MYIMYIYICLILTCEKEIYNVIWSPNRPPTSVTEEKSGTGVIAYVLGYPSSELASEKCLLQHPFVASKCEQSHRGDDYDWEGGQPQSICQWFL